MTYGDGVSRRTLFGGVAGLFSTVAFGGEAASAAPPDAKSSVARPSRLDDAYRLRLLAARAQRDRPAVEQQSNGDEKELSDYQASFTKALPHDELGIVDPRAYEILLAALESGDPGAFEAVPLGGYRRLANPQAALAFDLIGPDPAQLAVPPAPSFASAAAAAEMVELYWQALLRDVPFSAYGSDERVARACEDLSRLKDFQGPKREGKVVPETLFRGTTAGDLSGPYVSQFLWKRIPYLPIWVDQTARTAAGGLDYLDYTSAGSRSRTARWVAPPPSPKGRYTSAAAATWGNTSTAISAIRRTSAPV